MRDLIRYAPAVRGTPPRAHFLGGYDGQHTPNPDERDFIEHQQTYKGFVRGVLFFVTLVLVTLLLMAYFLL
jgi:hypothetical protein